MSTYSEDDIARSCDIGKARDKVQWWQDVIEHEVKCARLEGMSWAKIGIALGTSAQAAWQRYGLTPEQKRDLALAQERRFKQLEIDVDNMPAPVVELKAPRHKRKRNNADR